MNPLLFAGTALATDATIDKGVISFDDTTTEVRVDAGGLGVVTDNKHPEGYYSAAGLVLGVQSTCSASASVTQGRVELSSACAGSSSALELAFFDDATELTLDNGATVVVEAAAVRVVDAEGEALMEEEGIYFVGGMPEVITTSNFKVEIEGVAVTALSVDEPGTLAVDRSAIGTLTLGGSANVVTLSDSTVSTLSNTGTVGSLQLDATTVGTLDDRGSIRSTTTSGGAVIGKGPIKR